MAAQVPPSVASAATDILALLPGSGRPSVFELVMVDKLAEGLRPAFDYMLLSSVLQAFPRLAVLAGWRDELYALCRGLLERSYLTDPASMGAFSEALYGFARVPAPQAPLSGFSGDATGTGAAVQASEVVPGPSASVVAAMGAGAAASAAGAGASMARRLMTRRHAALSLFCIVGVPYVMDKLAKFHGEVQRGEIGSEDDGEEVRAEVPAAETEAEATAGGGAASGGDDSSDAEIFDDSAPSAASAAAAAAAARRSRRRGRRGRGRSGGASRGLRGTLRRLWEAVSRLLRRLRVMLGRLWPYAHVALGSLKVAYMARYVIDTDWPYFTPLLHLAGVSIERASSVVSPASSAAAAAASAGAGAGSAGDGAATEGGGAPAGGRLGTLMRLRSAFVMLVRIAVIGAVVVFKIAEWWYSGDAQAARAAGQSAVTTIPPPPLPPPIPDEGADVKLPRDPRLCPLCRRPRVNPAAATSGIVYCYKCLHDFVSEDGRNRCPVTGQWCEPHMIRRLMTSNG